MKQKIIQLSSSSSLATEASLILFIISERYHHGIWLVGWERYLYIYRFILSRISILPHGSLRILNASKSDEGRYLCQGVNVFGSAEIVASLSVKGMKKLCDCNDDFYWVIFKYYLESPANHKQHSPGRIKKYSNQLRGLNSIWSNIKSDCILQLFYCRSVIRISIYIKSLKV